MTSNLLISADQIQIPPAFPEILKDYAKHIIREQPKNIIGASAEYFSTIAKDRNLLQHYSFSDHDLKALFLKLRRSEECFHPDKELVVVSEDTGIPLVELENLKREFDQGPIKWTHYFAQAVSQAHSTTDTAMVVAHKIATDVKESDGDEEVIAAMVPITEYLLGTNPMIDTTRASEVVSQMRESKTFSPSDLDAYLSALDL